jgi:hypothetical protein
VLTHVLLAVCRPAAYGDGDPSVEHVLQVRLIIPSDQLQTLGRAILAGRADPYVGEGENGEAIELH